MNIDGSTIEGREAAAALATEVTRLLGPETVDLTDVTIYSDNGHLLKLTVRLILSATVGRVEGAVTESP